MINDAFFLTGFLLGVLESLTGSNRVRQSLGVLVGTFCAAGLLHGYSGLLDSTVILVGSIISVIQLFFVFDDRDTTLGVNK